MMKDSAVMQLETQETDDQLVERARQGDRYAFCRLLARYRRQAVRTAYAMLRSAEDAEDVAQEAFISVFRSLPAYRGEGKFSTWLYRIIVNLCASRQRLPSSREMAADSIELADTCGLEQAAISNAAVWAVLAALPTQQRAALVLREIDQLSYAEIAEIMGIAEGTVKYHISEARRSFRRIWTQEIGDEM